MDLIDDPAEGINAPEFSVSEISGAVKRLIEGEFSHVRIRGEIGRVSRPRSGHVYLDLKDDRAVISGVMWKGVAARLQTQPEEGMEVVATGRLTTFPGQSKYQIVIEDLKPAGMGALMALLEKRKTQLQAEGLFDPERKKQLPYLPDLIGVITSPSGAVIRDILHRLRDRFPRRVLIWPVAVQGANCAPEVARAIKGFNALSPDGAIPRPDLLIVARGGGSVEDLWGFNEEAVVRAAAASQIPLISAVGHETDTTLIDFVADRRAPTPTAAAELAVPVRHELMAWVENAGARMTGALSGGLERRGQRLRDLGRALPKADSLVEGPRQRLDMLAGKLDPALIGSVQRRKVRLSDMAGTLRPSILRRQIQNESQRLNGVAARLAPALTRLILSRRDVYDARASRLNLRTLQMQKEQHVKRFASVVDRLQAVSLRHVERLRHELESMDRLRETLSYKATLARGYAVVRGGGEIVTTKVAAQSASGLEIEFADGRLRVSGGAASRKSTAKPPEQGSLF